MTTHSSSTYTISNSALHKMSTRGIRQDFVPVAFQNGAWYHDALDNSVFHCRYHGHDVISRFKNNMLFVITVNTNVKTVHDMSPMATSPYVHKETADTSTNWRRKEIPSPVFKDVLKIARRIMDSHKQSRWVGERIDQIAT